MRIMPIVRRVAGVLPLRSWLLVAGVLALVVALAWASGKGAEGERAKQDRTALKTERRASAARETAGVERSADVDRTRQLEKDLTDATAPFPDSRPSDRRVAFNCQRLRDDGVDTRTVSACVRLEARGKAEPVAR